MKTLIALSILSVAPACGASVLYSSNFGDNTITAYDLATGTPLGVAVTAGPELSGLNGMRRDTAGNFIVAGQLTSNIVRYSPSGTLISVFDPTNLAGLSSPQDLTFGPDGKLYVADAGSDRIIRYDPATGDFIDTFVDVGSMGHAGPIGLAFGPDSNLYVSSFDQDGIFQINGTTGAVLNFAPGPPGLGFGPAAFGPDGHLYVVALDLNTFAGSVYRYNPGTHSLTLFIPEGSELSSPGGIAFDKVGSLLLSNLIFDQNFIDTGSTILRFNGTTGAFENILVPAGSNLNIPFFLTIVVPEPGSAALLGPALLLLIGCVGRFKP